METIKKIVRVIQCDSVSATLGHRPTTQESTSEYSLAMTFF